MDEETVATVNKRCLGGLCFRIIMGTRRSTYNNCVILVIILFSLLPSGFNCCDDEEADCQDAHALRLNYDLFEANSYNPLIRPVVNTSESLTINFTLALSTIINVDSKNQFIVTNVWLQMFWYDYQMTWDPMMYGKINETRMTSDRIWIPDIVLFNNADGNYEPSFTPNVVVYNTGDMKYIPPAIYTSSCSIDVEYFPFDQQVCEMKFGSWTFPGKTLRYQFQYGQNMMEMTDYMRNGAWNIISCSGHIEEIRDTITGEPKEIIVYELVIRRKTLFYTVNLIIPCFLHAIVCLCVFVLPEQGKKVSLVINVLVSLVVFLVLVQKMLPPSKKIPLIAKYFLFTFVMNVLEILVTVLIIFVSYKSPRTGTMPKWACWLLLYKLPKYLWMERPEHADRWQQKRCDDPPSYPSTPQIPRAALNVNASNTRQRFPNYNNSATHRDNVNESSPRKQYRAYHGSGSLTQSSAGSGCQGSLEDVSASAGASENVILDCSTHSLPPIQGHRCMLQDSALTGSEDRLDRHVRLRTPQASQSQSQSQPQRETTTTEYPLWARKDVYSAVNAVKFIWRQMQNKEEYETVQDDWKYIGAVLDRLLMVIFVLVTLGGTIGCLVNAPHILDTVDEEKILERIRNSMA